MERIAADGPNAQQIEYWNEVGGPRWVEMRDVIDAQISPLGEAAMERANPQGGQRVLDVGCGCGQTSLQLAERVGADGHVLGVDLSSAMLEYAREAAQKAGRANVEFRNADAQSDDFGAAAFDLIFSRFGVMFFSEPSLAFGNLCGALVPGGQLAFVAWQALSQNPWMALPLSAAAKHLPPQGAPPDPTAPGPFSFADSGRVESILGKAGFRDVSIEGMETELLVAGGRPLDQTVRFLTQLGPTGVALREQSADVREQVFDEIRQAIEPFQDSDGIRMPAAVWIVAASAPA